MKRYLRIQITKLPASQIHTGCAYCNYGGCVQATKTFGALGHWVWTAQSLKRNVVYAIKRLINRMTALDYSKIEDVEVDGIRGFDAPDFCDAYISSATYKGRKMTEKEIERLNEDSGYVYEAVERKLY